MQWKRVYDGNPLVVPQKHLGTRIQPTWSWWFHSSQAVIGGSIDRTYPVFPAVGGFLTKQVLFVLLQAAL